MVMYVLPVQNSNVIKPPPDEVCPRNYRFPFNPIIYIPLNIDVTNKFKLYKALAFKDVKLLPKSLKAFTKLNFNLKRASN